MLTHAQVRLLGFVDREFYGGKIGPAMRAVTKWLVTRLATGTPVVVSSIQINGHWLFVGNSWFRHFGFLRIGL